MLSLSFSWCPSSSFLNCYSAGAGDSGWCLHTHTYHNAVVAMLIIEYFLLHPRHQLPTLQSIACESQSTTGYTALTPTATCMYPLLYKPCCLSCWRPYDHLGHRCWSKLVPNLLLKLCQSLTNFYSNLTTFSKNNKLVIPSYEDEDIGGYSIGGGSQPTINQKQRRK